MKLSPVRQHREVRRVALETVEWAARFSLAENAIELARVRSIRVGELAAYTFSREKVEVVQLGADLITWLFLFDDAVGEAPAHMTEAEHRRVLDSYARVIRDRHLPAQSTAFHHALLDLVTRALQLGASADWLARFAHDMTDYFAGCADESQYRRNGRAPSVAAYRELRRQTVGTSPVFAIIELGVSGMVDSAEMARPDVVEARAIAALLTAWVNDVYSFPKEAAAQDPLNLVITLANEYQLDVREALEQAVEVYNLDLLELERIIDEVRATCPSDALMGYLQGLLEWVHGNRIWTRLCGRYF
ncbi:MAG TPA: hypothetical protein VFZ61_18810 [Polyangiales bacterium]